MSFRIVRITNLYKEYIDSYYVKNVNFVNQNYIDQYSDLANDSIEVVSSYSKFFNLIGVESFNLITNATQLQQTWAKENNVSFDLPFEQFIIEQIKFFKPDIVWIDDTRLMNKQWIQELRTNASFLRLIVGHICAPFNQIIQDSLSSFDIMFNCAPCTQEKFLSLGLNTYSIYHSFDHTLLDRININQDLHESLVFTGSLFTGYGLHKSRIDYIENLISRELEISVYGNIETRSTIFKKQILYYILHTLKSLGLGSKISKIPLIGKYSKHGEEKIFYYSQKLLSSIKPPVFGIEMLNLLANSDVCFNIHGEIAKKCAGNIRLFEATGVGSCLVTDMKDNMSELFEIDKEVVTYRSMDECQEKISWLINNPLEAKKIALAGQKRTLKDHTVEKRVEEVNSIFLKHLK
jgi:spore maturation protein CgeB